MESTKTLAFKADFLEIVESLGIKRVDIDMSKEEKEFDKDFLQIFESLGIQRDATSQEEQVALCSQK